LAAESTTQKNKGVSLPAYRRIEDDLRLKINDGSLPAGTMLSSRQNLAKEYGVALSTAQQAVANLIADGILETFDRKGTFVTQGRKSEQNGFNHIGEIVERPSHPSKVLRYSPRPEVQPQTSAKLGIVATARIDPNLPNDVGGHWARQAIRSMEQVFAAEGGRTQYIDRYPDHLGPYERGFDDINAIPFTDAIQQVLNNGANALVIVGLCDARDLSDAVVSTVDIDRIPTVYLSWHEIPPPLAQIYYDNRYAGYQAARHLLHAGYRKLVFFAPFSGTWLTERIEGARYAIKHAGLADDTLKVYPSEPAPGIYYHDRTYELTLEAANQAIDEGWMFNGSETDDPWGILAPNDHTALSILEAASEQNRTPGAHFGLIGFDDDLRACSAGLTTIRPPVEAMGEEAAKMLLRALSGEKTRSQLRLRSNIIPRASTWRKSKTSLFGSSLEGGL